MKRKIITVWSLLLVLLLTGSFAISASTLPNAYEQREQTHYYSSSAITDEAFATILVEKSHFLASENISVSFKVSEDDFITDFDYQATNLEIIDTSFYNHSVDFILACEVGTTECELVVDILLEDNLTVTKKLFVYNTSYGAFVSTINMEDAFEQWCGYAMENGIMAHDEYREIISQLYVMEEAITIDSMNIAESLEQADANAASSTGLRINCTFLWEDDFSSTHPKRGAKVELYVKNTSTNSFELYRTTETDDDGKVDITLPAPSASGYDLYMVIYASDLTGNITVRKSANNEIYSSYTSTFTGRTTDINSTFISQMLPSANYSSSFQAQQIFQALKTARDFAVEMIDTSLAPVKLVYPVGEVNVYGDIPLSYYTPANSSNGNVATITYPDFKYYGNGYVSPTLPNSYGAWDVIMHEYGHHVQRNANVDVMDMSTIGITHNANENLIDTFYNNSEITNAKDQGIKLAWVEAWPTVFSLLAQDYYKESLTGIKLVADDHYNSYNENDFNIEKDSLDGGEGNELSVAGVLWDLFDDSEFDEHDHFAMNYIQFWNVITENHAKTFSEFAQGFYNDHPSYAKDFNILLTAHGMSPRNIEAELNGNIPTFTWTAGGGSQYFPNDNFVLIFYNEAGVPILYTDKIYATSYTPSAAEWYQILNAYAADDDFLVAISAIQTEHPVTGEYVSIQRRFSKSFECFEGETIEFDFYTRYYEGTIDISGGDSIEYTLISSNYGGHIFQTTGDADTMIWVYKNDTLIAYDDNSGYGNNAYVYLYITNSDEYKIVVKKLYDFVETSPMKFILCMGEEYNDYSDDTSVESFDTLDNITTSTWLVIGDEVSSYEARVFKFTATSAGDYNFCISGDTDTSLYIVNPRDADLLVWREDFAHSGDYYLDFTCSLEAGVEYFVMICIDPSLEDIGYYELTITYLG